MLYYFICLISYNVFGNVLRDELIWWSINSCSLDVHVIEHFLSADSTIFMIEAMNARNISGYTNYPNEHEVILSPGICLQVVANTMHHTGGLHIVHLREIKVCEIEYNKEYSLKSLFFRYFCPVFWPFRISFTYSI